MQRTILGKWRDGQRASFNIIRGDAAVVDGNVAYFMNVHGEVCSYSSSTKRWSKLSKCPCKRSSLAVVKGLLTAIGGRKRSDSDPENKLLSLMGDRDKEWVEHFPPMPM